MKKKAFALFFITFILFSCMVIKFFFESTGRISHEIILGFDVDTSGNIYLGEYGKINVYNGGKLINEIIFPTTKMYAFFIEDDTLIIGKSWEDSRAKRYTLEGDYLSDTEYYFTEVLRIGRRTKVTIGEDVYQLKKYAGIRPYEVVRNGEVIYKMPKLEYIFNGLPYWSVIALGALSTFFAVALIISDYDERINSNVQKNRHTRD